MDDLTVGRAQELIREWDATGKPPACDFFRHGQFDITYGEHRCARCLVPKSIHQAYRLISRAVQHG